MCVCCLHVRLCAHVCDLKGGANRWAKANGSSWVLQGHGAATTVEIPVALRVITGCKGKAHLLNVEVERHVVLDRQAIAGQLRGAVVIVEQWSFQGLAAMNKKNTYLKKKKRGKNNHPSDNN